MKKTTLRVLSLLAVAGASSAWGQTTYFQDDFTASNGTDLIGRTPSVGSYAIVGTDNATNLTIQNNALRLSAASSADDVAATFTSAVSSATVYAGFDFSVAAAPSADGYFLGYRVSGTTYTSRLYLDNTGTGTFALGLGSGNSVTASWATNLTAGTTYRVVFSFTEGGATDSSSLWINPTSVGATSITITPAASTSVGSLLLRQDSSFGQIVTLDNLIVSSSFDIAAAIPESSSFAAVAGMGAMGFYALRRRRAV